MTESVTVLVMATAMIIVISTATRALALVGDRLLKNCIRSEDNRSTKKTCRSSFDEPVEAESKLSQSVFDSRV